MAFQTDNGQFTFDADVSDETVGAILFQVQSGVEKVTGYRSQTLGKSEKITQLTGSYWQ